MNDRRSILYVGDEFVDEIVTGLDSGANSLSVHPIAESDAVLDRLPVRESSVDCIVCEHHPPELDAIEFLQSARRRTVDVPAVLLTTDGSESLASDAVSADVSEYVDVRENGDSWADGVETIEARAEGSGRDGTHAEPATPVEPETPYRDLVEQNIAGVYEIQGDEFTYVNAKFADIFGYTPEELVGSSPFDVVVEREHRRLQDNVARLARGEVESVQTELRGLRKDGNEIVVEVHGQLVEQGPDPIYHGFVKEITDRKRRERRFEAVFNNTYQFTGLMEPDGTILEVNDPALSFLGQSRDDLVGKHIWDLEVFRANESARAIAREAVEQARNGRQFRDEIHLQGADRELVLDFTVRPVTDEEGDVTLLIPEGHDVTEREEREREYRTVVDRVTDAIVEVDDDWRFTLVDDRAEEIYGIDEGDLLGEHFWDVFSKELGTRFETVYRDVMETREPDSLEEYSPTLDDWFDVQVYPASDGGISFYFRTITDRKQREERASGLNEMLTEFMEADTKRRLGEIAVETASDRLNFPVAMVALVDEDGGDLSPVARSTVAEEHAVEEVLLDGDTGAAWEAYVTGEPATIDDPTPGLLDDVGIDELFVHPVGRHGVLVLGSPVPNADFVRTVAENVRRSLDRVERESLLQEREEVLEERNERLDRLNRVNRVIRQIDQVLVGASTRGEIERAVCEELVETESYTFAWIGNYDAATERIRPREWAGDERGYLEATSFSAAEDVVDQAPPGRAVRFQEPQVMDTVLTDPPREQWREAALRRDYRSSIALPLTYRDSLYGVLTVYGDQSGLFDTLEREVLTELSETIAHAINAAESKKALVSDTIVDVELRVTDPDHPLWEFLEEDPEREYELEGVVPTDDGEFRAFHTIYGATPAEILESTRRSVALRESRVIAERDDACLFESIVTEESLIFWLLDRGAVPRSMSVSRDGGRIRVELSGDVDVREFVELFKAEYPNSELVASRERERPVRTRQDFRASVEEELTTRQREILRTAYLSGYFESPRERKGTDIADSMDISPSTFSDHVRAGLRNLFGLLYEEKGTPSE